jgi:alginate O-acetyltransferase complex protein AlgI
LTASDISSGASRILLGLFMKMVVAEVLAEGWTRGEGVNAGFGQIGKAWGGLDVWFLAVGFGAQLFLDFAGYSHIVIGAARLLGIRLDENFERPYLAPTIAAFWTRWHISLSLWIRDYVFLPMASMRRGRWWVYSSLMCSMIVCGLWHEATLGFIAWGAYHGCLLTSHRVAQQIKRARGYTPMKFGGALSCTLTLALVSAGWIFFRASSLAQALTMYRAILTPSSYGRLSLPVTYYVLIAVVVSGWACFHISEALLDAGRRTYQHDDSTEAAIGLSLPISVRFRMITIALIDYCTARRWWWLTPALIVIGLFGGLAILDLKPSVPRTPVMYTLF